MRNPCKFDNFINRLSSSDRARLRSCAGPNAGRWLSAIPSEKQLELECNIFRCAIFRRLGLPVSTNADNCEGCSRSLDSYGWHRTTCMRSGRVQLRHKPLIKIWIRIFREAGVNIPQRDVERLMHLTHIRRGPNDMRRMDIITAGIDGIYGGLEFMEGRLCSWMLP